MNPIAIIGAGPAGLACAMKIKENGIDVNVFEEHEDIGEPEHCSGLISKKGLEELGVLPGKSLQNEIKGARIYSPSGQYIEVKRKETVAFVVNRKEFDQMLLRRARLLNIHVATQTKLIDVRNNTLFVQAGGRGELRKSDYVIGADGVNSTVRHLMGIQVPKENYVHTMQTTLTGEFNDKIVEVHLGEFAKGFFGWVIPISKEKAKVGIGTTLGEDVNLRFREFVKKRFPNSRIRKADSALIPCGPPLQGIAKNNLAIVGDAAFQTKATTGGGIIFGMKAGNVLGEIIAQVAKGKANISEYEKQLDSINKELRLHWKLRRFLNGLKDKEIDDLIIKLKQKGIEEFLEKEGDMDEPSKFIGKLARNPKYFFLAGTLLKFLTS
ncbi:MAG: NAD(P)/FAD-dependent oxidoreductase [Candidatus Diapherotrites archaeon]|nr:NAD(P)/FAD-dependent oxidoreductase [Candidatus Diapherotrites archaeon]